MNGERDAPLKLSCIVPLYNCLPLTQAMLASLRATLPADLPHEIILVDDGSTDGTREWLATLPVAGPIRVVLNDKNLGYAASNNRAATGAQGELLALLNNDLVLSRGWLEPMLAVWRRLGPQAGLIGNVQRAAATGELDHAGIRINLKGKPEHDRRPPALPALRPRSAYRRVAAVTGACVLLSRELFLELNGFSTLYRNGGEDVDLSFRAAAQGRVNAVALRSVVEHHVSSSPNRKLRDEQNSYQLTLAWRDTLARLAARRWCRHQLWKDWTSPREPVDAFAAAGLLAYALHLRRRPPPAALDGMQAALNVELARWRTLFPPDAAF